MDNIQVVVFDCDGVMFETKEANMAYYNQILKFFNKPPLNREQSEYAFMHTADATLSHLFDDEETLGKARDYRKKLGYLPFINLMKEDPYLKPLLQKLKPRYKTAVAKNRADTMVHVIKIHGLEGLFDLVVTALDVNNPKPHPESLIKILEHFKASPNEAIYIGDSELDEKAARDAGVYFVSNNNKSLNADFHIESLKEMEALLLN